MSVALQGNEPIEFWTALIDDELIDAAECVPQAPPKPHVPLDFKPVIPRLYIVGLGMGYLELPQVEVPGNKLLQEHLQTKSVYILDCYSDLFVWVGKKSTRLVRAAALKLSSELFAMLQRPDFAMIHRVSEGTESQVFQSKFAGTSVFPVDEKITEINFCGLIFRLGRCHWRGLHSYCQLRPENRR